MAGETTTSVLADSLPTMRMAARLVAEQTQGNLRETVDRQVLGKNVGNTWSEVDFAKMTAAGISETTDLINNPQELSDTLRTISPSDGGIHILVTDRVLDRIFSQAASVVRTGVLAMNAILRKNNLDGIVLGRSATTDMGAAGAPLTGTLVRHTYYRISSNTTEPTRIGPYHLQHHGFSLADIDDELSAPMGTHPITAGLTQEVIERAYATSPRMLGNVNIHENGDMTIDASDDSEGFVYSRDGIIHVEAAGVRVKPMDRPNIGGGATSIFTYWEYAYGQRGAGIKLFSITADATAPA